MNEETPLVKSTPLRVFIFIVCFFITQVISGLLLTLVLWLEKSANGPTDAFKKLYEGENSFNAIAILITMNFITGMLLVLFFRKVIDRRSVYSLGWEFTHHYKDALVGLCAGIACIGAGTLILIAMQQLHFTGWDIDGWGLMISVVLLILVAIVEEMIFRGYILNNLLPSVNKYKALILSSLIFAVAHGANPDFNGLAFINIFLAGLFLGINYIFTRNLWYAVVLHFTWNFFQGPVLGYKVSGTNFPTIFQQELTGNDFITGGKFGLEASVIASVLILLFTVTLAWVYQKKSAVENNSTTDHSG